MSSKSAKEPVDLRPTREPYEPPLGLRLTDADLGAGGCTIGSAPTGSCRDGATADAACGKGNAAQGACGFGNHPHYCSNGLGVVKYG
jgi:hypothetical protein